jgi:radical SAM superfamily enzyme YgiQ (UPF0313 family)
LNILLVYPEFPDTFWSFKHALRFVSKKAASPPLGLLTVAALLPSHWPVKLVDLNVRPLSDQDLAWSDLVMVSAMAVQRDSARTLIERCHLAGKRMVAGGPLFSGEPEAFPLADYLVLAEAEVTLPGFLDDLARGEAKRVYTSTEYADLNRSPAPRYELLNHRQYSTMSVQTSRGCPYQCDFCNVTALFGHRPRFKSAKQVIAELEAIYQAGWRSNVFFVDDNFIGNRRYAKEELLPAIIEWRQGKKDLVFSTQLTINLADDQELMDLMVKAGFQTAFIGIETPDDLCLAECGKSQNQNRNLVESVHRIQRSGIEVQGGFIVGFDSDTPSIFQRQIDFIQKSGIVTAMVGLLQALSGTPLYQRLKDEGRLTWEGSGSGDNVDGTTNIVPRMDLTILMDGYRHILEQIYTPKFYYQRIRTFLKEFKAPGMGAHMDWLNIRAFFRSVFRLGILGRERGQYWRLFFWTLVHRPKAMAQAITFSIYGFHFSRIFQLYFKKSAPSPGKLAGHSLRA